MSRARYQINQRAIQDLAATQGVHAAKREAAKAITAQAQAIAPATTGDYRRKLRWISRSDVTAAAATDMAGHLVEFGSVRNPAYAPLRRAVAQLGYRFTARGR